MTAIANNKANVLFETKRILVTPDLAKRTLEFSKIANRRINPVRVKYFVRLLKQGQFMCTHQGIALDGDGNILDGRHRLTAIVESKCSVYMMVSKGVPTETMSVIDCNQPRTLLNRLSISGNLSTTPTHISTVRILEYGIVGASQAALGIEDAKCLLDKYGDALDFVILQGKIGTKVPAAVCAVLARAYYTKRNRQRIMRFIEVYKNETPENDGETGALRLKRHVMVLKKKGIQSYDWVEAKRQVYWLAESAVDRFIKCENVRILNAATTELFPTPFDT